MMFRDFTRSRHLKQHPRFLKIRRDFLPKEEHRQKRRENVFVNLEIHSENNKFRRVLPLPRTKKIYPANQFVYRLKGVGPHTAAE